MIKPNQKAQKAKVFYISVDNEYSGQRIDNFLLNQLKGLPKSRIYSMVRKGEVRVNKKRVGPFYRVQENDSIRIPPVEFGEKAKTIPPSLSTQQTLIQNIIYEDENLFILNKPHGMSVHGGSSVRLGVIEILKTAFPQYKNLELAHRLDSDTSGCLIISKKRSVLKQLHTLLREGKIIKIYWALTQGRWKRNEREISLPLKKFFLKDGKKIVRVDPEGKPSRTSIEPLQEFKNASLVKIRLHSGRTHQIRVHAQYLKHPIAGDVKYGDPEFNEYINGLGLKRMFLHAKSLEFVLPSTGKSIHVESPLEHSLEQVIEVLNKS